jgi:phosphatidate cytidylyltransferase
MALLLITLQSYFAISIIFEGMIWFVHSSPFFCISYTCLFRFILPVTLVVLNDIAAYFCGLFFGKTPLIRLSPKKTWEGFVGAAVITVILAFFLPLLLVPFPFIICPVNDLSFSAFHNVTCSRSILFLPHEYPLPEQLQQFIQRMVSKTN